MHTTIPLACFLSLIRPPGIEFENSLLQIAPVDKAKCPFVRDSSDVGFQLYTRRNPTVHQELVVGDDEKLSSSHIDFNDYTVIYFHAFMENPNDGSAVLIREAYMLRGDTNVIMVDAQRLEAGPWYFTAAENTWYIGRFAAQFIDYMVARGLDLSKTHLVGHSLGAQAAGVAGAALRSGRVSRITGLDPALPLFGHLSLEQRLDPSDADFVDVIHTDAGIFGVNHPTGHADFYPNGGISPQPGCELEVVIPQQLILNKCNTNNTYGYYTFHLKRDTTNKHTSGTFQKDYNLIGRVHILPKYEDAVTFEHVPKQTDNPKSTTIDSNIKLAKYSNKIKKKLHKTITQETTNVGLSEQLKKTDKANIKHTKFNYEKRLHIHQTETQKPITTENDNTKTDNQQTPIKSHVIKRQKRFIPFLRRSETQENENFLFRILDFVFKNRKLGLPVFTVMREINTMVKSANGELNHSSKERNNYIGSPPVSAPITYMLELGNEGRVKAFVKRLFGLGTKGDKLTITGAGK